MKLSAKISNLRRVLVNKVGLSTEDQQEFEAIYADLLEIEKATPIAADHLDTGALSQILENARTDREVSDLFLDLHDGEYDKKYSSWNNIQENFKGRRLKANSLIDNIRRTINGMINEIKRLEKENEALKHIGK